MGGQGEGAVGVRGRPLSSRAHSPPWHQHTRHTHPQPDSHAAAAAQLTRALHARLDANGARRALVEPQRPRQRVPKRITCTHAACRQATSSAAAAAAARRRAGTHRQRAQIHLPPPPTPHPPPHTQSKAAAHRPRAAAPLGRRPPAQRHAARGPPAPQGLHGGGEGGRRGGAHVSASQPATRSHTLAHSPLSPPPTHSTHAGWGAHPRTAPPSAPGPAAAGRGAPRPRVP